MKYSYFVRIIVFTLFAISLFALTACGNGQQTNEIIANEQATNNEPSNEQTANNEPSNQETITPQQDNATQPEQDQAQAAQNPPLIGLWGIDEDSTGYYFRSTVATLEFMANGQVRHIDGENGIDSTYQWTHEAVGIDEVVTLYDFMGYDEMRFYLSFWRGGYDFMELWYPGSQWTPAHSNFFNRIN